MTTCGGHSQITYRGCRDCGAPISMRSRGRCTRCGRASLQRACPDDFLIMLKQLGGSKAAARHYNASLKTITRWRLERGLNPGQLVKRRQRRKLGSPYGRPGGLPRVEIFRDMTAAGFAADYLRKFGAVYRCGENGKPVAKGGFWNRNGRVLTDEDIISRAERLGWKRPEGVFAE